MYGFTIMIIGCASCFIGIGKIGGMIVGGITGTNPSGINYRLEFCTGIAGLLIGFPMIVIGLVVAICELIAQSSANHPPVIETHVPDANIVIERVEEPVSKDDYSNEILEMMDSNRRIHE